MTISNFYRSLVAASLTACCLSAHSFSLEGSLFDEVGRAENVDPLLLYAIAITESSYGVGNGNIQPQPYTIRSKRTGPRYFADREAAAELLAQVLVETDLVDVGMMQINLRHHPQPDPYKLLDPEENLLLAARYLKQTLASTADPVLGVGRYHNWADESLARWYGQRVWQTYRNLSAIQQ